MLGNRGVMASPLFFEIMWLDDYIDVIIGLEDNTPLTFGVIILLDDNIDVIIWLDDNILHILIGNIIWLDDNILHILIKISSGWMITFFFSFGITVWWIMISIVIIWLDGKTFFFIWNFPFSKMQKQNFCFNHNSTATRVSSETSFVSKHPKLKPKLVSALSETRRLFLLFRLNIETESFGVSKQPKQTKDQLKQQQIC